MNSGVAPLSVLAWFISAPVATSACTTSRWPFS
eukprot:CAMPEP_0118965466 /NCGR_PEP_ID=MMETSP1173-20130426/3041_1 /TAXON_ID=1034831 /ORGANISM="Rhizochromulina marina cf, Strain CCMP1243" /LENGTH=32 /DNA_ID= /DNA_START= /DNA_END= /DNA_ORIENTATION=